MSSNGNEAVRAANPNQSRVVNSKKVWTCLITNTKYLSGLLVMDYALKLHKSKYPLIALYTDTFPPEGHKALDIRGIPKKHIRYLVPNAKKDYDKEPRFYDCWTKLTPFSLVEYDRVVQIDSDMLILQNMDELMDIELDPPSMEGRGDNVFAAVHACVCNPKKLTHYPKDWVPEACAYTSQHSDPDDAQIHGPLASLSLGMPNGGLQVINPCAAIYERILKQLTNDDAVETYDFADQSMLGDIFFNRWQPLPYVYNALKTLRWKDVHSQIWRDERVKNLHYILSPKPWEEADGNYADPTHAWWHELNHRRLEAEKQEGLGKDF